MTILSCLLLPFACEASPLQAERLSYELSGLLPRDARWRVVVVELKSGREIISAGNKTGPMLPGSLVKMVTAGTALELETEGNPVTMLTEILLDGEIAGGIVNGNIYLRGSGNCLLSVEELRKAARTLQEIGITTVTGGVVADTSRLDARGLERTRQGAGHAPAGALGLDLHTVSMSVVPTEPGKTPKVTIAPPNSSVRFAVSARTVAGGKNTASVIRGDDSSFQVNGVIPRDSGLFRWRFPLIDPPGFAAQSFRTVLAEAGIQVHGEAGKGRAPAGVTTVATIPGPPTERLVREMNHNSLNVAADNLLLVLGFVTDGSPGTRGKGLKALRKHLARHGIAELEADFCDGSGLLPCNRVTPRAMASYLAAAARQEWFPALYQSLPRAGIDGTLRSGDYRNERFRAKSGSLENVAALAGYGVDRSGREIAFAFIVNTPGPLPPSARGSGDSIMRFLADEVLQ